MVPRVRIKHKNKVILSNAVLASSIFRISVGLMFSGKKKIKEGMCLLMPDKDLRFGASVTMMFCFYSMEILFVNSKFQVVDKKVLRPWKFSYTPKDKCRYVIESLPGTFNGIEEGDLVQIKEI